MNEDLVRRIAVSSSITFVVVMVIIGAADLAPPLWLALVLFAIAALGGIFGWWHIFNLIRAWRGDREESGGDST